MSITGEIQGLYKDRAQTQAVFPMTKVKAVSDDNGTGLDAILADMNPQQWGLGVVSLQTSFISTTTELDAIRVNCWFIFTGGTANPITVSGYSIQYGGGRVDTYNGNNVVMTLYPYLPHILRNSGSELRRTCNEGTWGEWEWVNPPMETFKEYRTVERWEGKSVYRKLLPFWNIPSNGSKEVDTDLPLASTYIVSCRLRTSVGGDFIVSNSNIKSVAAVKNNNTGFWAMYMETGSSYSSDSDIYWDISYCYK